MSKASEWANSFDERPVFFVAAHDGKDWVFRVSETGSLEFGDGFKFSVYIPDDQAVPLALWIIDTFGDSK